MKYNFWYWFDRLLFRKCWRVQNKYECSKLVSYFGAVYMVKDGRKYNLYSYDANSSIIYKHTPVFTVIHEERLP